MSNPVPPHRWGKDHWSLLGYVAACFDGVLDREGLRCNEQNHPLLAGHRRTEPWNNAWSTKLKNPDEKLLGHDDWDCLDDLESARLIEILSVINGFVRLTPRGNAVAFKLRQHTERGGMFVTFKVPSNLTYE